MDTIFCEVRGSRPDTRDVLVSMLERSFHTKVSEGMVCDGDEDDDYPILPRDAKNKGALVDSYVLEGQRILVYEKDIENYKAKLCPYNDGVAKMLFDDSAQGKRLIRMVMKEVCHIEAHHIQHQDLEIYHKQAEDSLFNDDK